MDGFGGPTSSGAAQAASVAAAASASTAALRRAAHKRALALATQQRELEAALRTAATSPPPPVCECCGVEGADKRCGRCRESWYCSAACQTRHWKEGHKTKCVEKTKTNTAPPAAAFAQSGGSAGTGTTIDGNTPSSVRELKAVLDSRGVDYSTCVEKSELRALAEEHAAAPVPSRGSGGADDEKCTICLDAMRRPQTMPCGHRFCRECVAGMRRHGVGEAQVCPLCRGPMPDAELKHFEAVCLMMQHDQEKTTGERGGAQKPKLLNKAIGLFRDALTIDPEYPQAHCALGTALYKYGDADGATSAFRAATAADPHDSLAHYQQGVLLYERGDIAGAEASYRAAVAANPQDANAHVNLGNILGERGDLAQADAEYCAAVAADPQHAIALNNMGLFRMEQTHDLDDAEAKIRAAIAADPHYTLAHYNLGVLLAMRMDHASSAASFAKAWQIDPSFREGEGRAAVKRCLLEETFNTGQMQLKSGNIAGGAASFAKALQLDPSDADVKGGLAAAHCKLGAQAFERVASAGPEALTGALAEQMTAGELNGDFAAALASFAKVAQIGPLMHDGKLLPQHANALHALNLMRPMMQACGASQADLDIFFDEAPEEGAGKRGGKKKGRGGKKNKKKKNKKKKK